MLQVTSVNYERERELQRQLERQVNDAIEDAFRRFRREIEELRRQPGLQRKKLD